ncbi:MAG TPA: aldolase [Alphaproteobacteria bacterium]|jgi:L-fuculose-phosphate aldolase
MDATRDATHARVDRDLDAHLLPITWSEAEQLILAARILAAGGHCAGLAGQLTQRLSDGTFRSLPIGVGFDEARPANLLRVDENLNVVEGKGIPNPAVRFHLWIYRKRPDAMAIVHTHPPKASALAMIGKPLVVSHMDTAMLYDDVAFLPEWPGVPVADEEGHIISAALGGKRSILLAHHGILATGRDIVEATYLAMALELAARLQLDAEAAGTVKPIRPEFGRQAHDFMLKPAIVGATFAWWARNVLRQDPQALA